MEIFSNPNHPEYARQIELRAHFKEAIEKAQKDNSRAVALNAASDPTENFGHEDCPEGNAARELPEPVTASLHVATFVLTGGPGGGKSKALLELSKPLEATGYKVWRIPEMATFLVQHGHVFLDENHAGRDQQTHNFLLCIIALEALVQHSAQTHQRHAPKGRSIVLADRGLLCYPFFAPGYLDRYNIQAATLTKSYHAVFHMETTAWVDWIYNAICCNNSARQEDAQKARKQDEEIKSTWLKHHTCVRSIANPKNETLAYSPQFLSRPENIQTALNFLWKQKFNELSREVFSFLETFKCSQPKPR